MTTNNTQTARVLSFLQSGNVLTEGQARTRFGVRNMSALASNLRFKGYAVYCNPKKTSKGNTVATFRIGAPRRSVVAAGYRALAAA